MFLVYWSRIRVLTVPSIADRMADLRITTDDRRENVGLIWIVEAMINILPGEIGNSRFLVQPQERHRYMGELVNSCILYPCDFISWANQQDLLHEFECGSHTAYFGRTLLMSCVGPDEQSLMKEPVG